MKLLTVVDYTGIPSSILNKATKKSSELEINYGRRERKPRGDLMLMKDEEVAVIRDLFGVAENWRRHVISQATGMSLLLEIQRRAQLLLLRN